MIVSELYAASPEAVKFGLCIKGLKTGVMGVLVPPFSSDFDATAHFFHEDDRGNGYGHFNFEDCKNEVMLDEEGNPRYLEHLPV